MNNNPITRSDIMSMTDFAKVRQVKRRALVELKRNRRVPVGPDATFYFENWDTMWFQIHEMLFIEKGGESQISGELDAYNPMIPNGNELVTTLMFEVDDPKRRAKLLGTLGGVEETVTLEFAGHVITEVVEKLDDKCKSIMGGIGGTFLLDEYRRGASGTMPAGHFTDIVVSIWNALDTQKKDKDGNYEINDRARILWESLLPSLNFERRFGVTAYKWVFWKRGIIESPTTRFPSTKPFDSSDQMELQKIMDRLSPLMT